MTKCVSHIKLQYRLKMLPISPIYFRLSGFYHIVMQFFFVLQFSVISRIIIMYERH